jgi:CRP/FNR family transcriptional regulator, cyclic AMP receptor protein
VKGWDTRSMKPTKGDYRCRPIAWETLCSGVFNAKTLIECGANVEIYRQGERARSLFYLRQGEVRLAVTSRHGREGVVGVLGAGEFFGEGCLAGQPLRMTTATVMTHCTANRIGMSAMTRLLHDRQEISELFVAHLLSRNIRYEAALVDQVFDSTEKRLARMLLLLAHFGDEGKARPVVPRISQAGLARMVGTSRAKVGHFLNKFRAGGLIDCSRDGTVTVHGGLLKVVLHD